MSDLRTELQKTERWRLIRYVASAIHDYTVMNRDPDLPAETKAEVNQMIHYLAGHSFGLAKADEPLMDWSLDGITRSVELLHPTLRKNIRARLSEEG